MHGIKQVNHFRSTIYVALGTSRNDKVAKFVKLTIYTNPSRRTKPKNLDVEGNKQRDDGLRDL